MLGPLNVDFEAKKTNLEEKEMWMEKRNNIESLQLNFKDILFFQ